MQIKIEPYNPIWKSQYENIKNELTSILKEYNPLIEHFGSTSVPELSAKPVIDILVGIDDISKFEAITQVMSLHSQYIYYRVFDEDTPNRRLFVRLKDGIAAGLFQSIYDDWDTIPHSSINEHRLSHIHIWKFNSDDWIRHIAFRDYLIHHEDVRIKYENLKKELSKSSWKDGMEYNSRKNDFIQREETKAIQWYKITNGLI